MQALSWKVNEWDFTLLEQKTQTLDLKFLEFCNPCTYEQKGDSINASEEA